MKQKKEIHAVNRYCGPDSILIIDRKGILRRLYCPFRVQVLPEAQVGEKGQILDVLAVAPSETHKLLFVIGGKDIPYHFFRILL